MPTLKYSLACRACLPLGASLLLACLMYQFNFAKAFNTYARLSNVCIIQIIPLQSETKPNLHESIQIYSSRAFMSRTTSGPLLIKQCNFKFYASTILPTHWRHYSHACSFNLKRIAFDHFAMLAQCQLDNSEARQ